MSDKIPKIYKNKIDKLRTKVQKDFYYHSDNEINNRAITPSKISRSELLDKINAIFKRPDFVYQADVIIMYKTGENKHKKVVGLKENYLITLENEKIMLDDILDIK